MSETPVPGHRESRSHRLAALAASNSHSVSTGDLVDDRTQFEGHQTDRRQALEWTGPLAFATRCGAVPGVDHDLGRCWGSNGDQRVRLRVEDDGGAGLLYVYDQTWDEYAVLGSDVPLDAAENASSRGLRLGEHPSVEDFVAALRDVPALRPSPRPEL